MVVGGGRNGWKGSRDTNFSYKINKSLGHKVHHVDYNQWSCIANLKAVKKVSLKSSHHKKKNS